LRKPVELSDQILLLRSPASVPERWVVEAYADPSIRQWNPADVTDAASARRWIRSRADWSDGTHASWVLTDAKTQAPVGALSLHKINHDNLSASIGYWTIKSARGRGFATRAVRMATEWGFDALGLQRIELIHAVANGASCAVATANHFSLEGTVKKGEKYGDGKWYDEHIHGRIASSD
jgi:RimJ/RimL family protein N-acetyltransferase